MYTAFKWLETYCFNKQQYLALLVDRNSVVGIATRYCLDGLGIESRWGSGFSNSSRPPLGSTHPPIQRVSGLSLG